VASVEFGDAARARLPSEKARAVPPAPSPSARGQRRPCNSCRTALPAGIQFAPKLCPEVSLRCHFAVIDRLKAIHSADESYSDGIIRVARG
jgi:hypothetical protein